MKAQGLPVTTIVLIILVVIVLVGVAIFFFTGFGEGEENVGEQNKYSFCQTACLKLKRNAIGTNEYESYGADNINCSEYLACEEDGVNNGGGNDNGDESDNDDESEDENLCGNGVVDPGEDCESDNDCGIFKSCNDCKCTWKFP